MRARAFPAEHPDAFLTSNLTRSVEPFREVMDRRRGFVAKSASLHSDSPAKPSPTSLPDFTGQSNGNGSANGNGMFSSSPLQHSMPPPPPGVISDVYPPIANPPLSTIPVSGHAAVPPPGLTMQDRAFDPLSFNQANFTFPSGQQGWNGLGSIDVVNSQAPNGMSPFPQQTVPTPGGDVGFDWLNWLSTANVTMMAPDEQAYP